MSRVNELVIEALFEKPLGYYAGRALRGVGDTLYHGGLLAAGIGAVPFLGGAPHLMSQVHNNIFQPVDMSFDPAVIGGIISGAGYGSAKLGSYLNTKGRELLQKYKYSTSGPKLIDQLLPPSSNPTIASVPPPAPAPTITRPAPTPFPNSMVPMLA